MANPICHPSSLSSSSSFSNPPIFNDCFWYLSLYAESATNNLTHTHTYYNTSKVYNLLMDNDGLYGRRKQTHTHIDKPETTKRQLQKPPTTTSKQSAHAFTSPTQPQQNRHFHTLHTQLTTRRIPSPRQKRQHQFHTHILVDPSATHKHTHNTTTIQTDCNKTYKRSRECDSTQPANTRVIEIARQGVPTSNPIHTYTYTQHAY